MFQPSSEIQRTSTLTAFLNDCEIDSYEELVGLSNEEPEVRRSGKRAAEFGRAVGRSRGRTAVGLGAGSARLGGGGC